MYIHYDYKSGILFERPDWSTGFLSFSFSEIIVGNHETSVFWCGASHKEHVSNLEWKVIEIPLKWMGVSCKKGVSCPMFFWEVKFRSKADLWPLETFGFLIFIEEEHIWGSFPFSNRSFKFQFLHILWKQNVKAAWQGRKNKLFQAVILLREKSRRGNLKGKNWGCLVFKHVYF